MKTTARTAPKRPKTRPRAAGLVFFESQPKSVYHRIKAEAIRIGTNGSRKGFKFAERLFRALPELKNL